MKKAPLTPRSTSRLASSMYGTSKRLTIKPGVSLQATGTFFMVWESDMRASKTGWDVSGVRLRITQKIKRKKEIQLPISFDLYLIGGGGVHLHHFDKFHLWDLFVIYKNEGMRNYA